MDSDGPRCKRRRLSNDKEEIVNNLHASSSLTAERGPAAMEMASATTDVRKLQVFEQRENTLRSAITCKICFRMLYEPFTLGCGHTYCYSCINSWITSSNTRKKTCPDCRAAIDRAPAPAFALREIVRELLNKAELLPEGETVADHELAEIEESNQVEIDKGNKDPDTGGLFKGLFKKSPPRDGRRLEPIYDEEDNVERCPLCHHELEGHVCQHCDWRYGSEASEYGDSEGDSDEFHRRLDDMLDDADELDHELDAMDDDMPLGWPGLLEDMVAGSDLDEDEDEDDADTSLDGFIEDDEEEEDEDDEDEEGGHDDAVAAHDFNDSEDESSSTTVPRAAAPAAAGRMNAPRRRRRYMIEESSDEEADETDRSAGYNEFDASSMAEARDRSSSSSSSSSVGSEASSDGHGGDGTTINLSDDSSSHGSSSVGGVGWTRDHNGEIVDLVSDEDDDEDEGGEEVDDSDGEGESASGLDYGDDQSLTRSSPYYGGSSRSSSIY